MRAGFTLLEVVIALLIFVLAFTSLMALYSAGAASHHRSLDQTHARLIAERLAAEIRTQQLSQDKPKNVVDETYPGFDGLYRYDITFKPHADKRAFHVTLTVKWGPRDSPETEVFETVMLRRLPE